MKIIFLLILGIALAYICGVRIHPDKLSKQTLTKVSSWLTVRKQDQLWNQNKKSAARPKPVAASVWGKGKRVTAQPKSSSSTSSSSGQPTAKEAVQKANALSRKATFAAQF